MGVIQDDSELPESSTERNSDMSGADWELKDRNDKKGHKRDK